MLYIYVYVNIMCVYIYLWLLHSDLLNYCVGEDEVRSLLRWCLEQVLSYLYCVCGNLESQVTFPEMMGPSLRHRSMELLIVASFSASASLSSSVASKSSVCNAASLLPPSVLSFLPLILSPLSWRALMSLGCRRISDCPITLAFSLLPTCKATTGKP